MKAVQYSNNINKLIAQEKTLFSLRDRILEEGRNRNIILRVSGGVGFRTHCPEYKFWEYNLGRSLHDIDFVGYKRQIVEIVTMFHEFGYEENMSVKYLFGTERRIFYNQDYHIDVFLDKLKFCHDINLVGRLEIDYPTISLADLLLEKLQIVKLNEKDIINIIVLLREHQLGQHDNEAINTDYLSYVCSKDWGLWKTITTNIKKVKKILSQYKSENINDNDLENVNHKLDQMSKVIERKKKSLKWKIRSLIGENVKWYREVEEVKRDEG